MTATSPEPSNCQRSEDRHNSKMASEPEHSGACRARDRAAVTSPQSAAGKAEAALSDTAHADPRPVSVDDLPDEVLIKIFSHVSFSELLDVVPRVCSRWRRLSQDSELWADKEYHVRAWSEMDSDTCKGGTTDLEAIRTFRDAPNLRSVCMRRGASSRVFRALYGNCRRLSVLQLHVTQKLSYSVLKNLVEKCSGIHTLRISNELLKREKFSAAVSQLAQLRVLNLVMRFTRSAPALRPLADGCPQLAEVDFKSTVVDVDDLRYFLRAKRHTLKSVRIKWTMGGKTCVPPLLAACADRLERLQLYSFDVTRDEAREAFAALGSLKNLRELKMAIVKPAPPGTAALAFSTGGLPKLTLLDLRGGYGLDDDAVTAVSRGCPALRELSFRGCHLLSDAAFSQVHRLECLEILDVSRCRGLGGALMPYLTGLPRLHTLLVENVDFPKLQPGLSSILELSNLCSLTLNHSVVAGVPFEKFPQKLVNLRELSIAWCRGDLKAIDGLAGQMPNLKIHGKVEVDEPAFASEVRDSDAELPEEENEEIVRLAMRTNRATTVRRVTKTVVAIVSVAVAMRVLTLFGMEAVCLSSF